MKSQAALRKIAANEVPVADYVPYGAHVATHVIKLRDTGDYIAIWKLEGISFETTEFDELNARKEALNNFLRTLSGGQFALWQHKVRREVSDRLEGSFTNSFCADLNDRYYASFKGYRMLATELYVTLVYRPSPSKVVSLFKRMAKRSAERRSRSRVSRP